jgi:predicted aspartyl protease
VEVRAVLGDETRAKVRAVRALVDTGATLTVIPGQLAGELGVKPHAQARVETGAGEIVPVLIPDMIDRVLIGVTTLEALGLEVDPVTGTLRRAALPLYSLARA